MPRDTPNSAKAPILKAVLSSKRPSSCIEIQMSLAKKGVKIDRKALGMDLKRYANAGSIGRRSEPSGRGRRQFVYYPNQRTRKTLGYLHGGRKEQDGKQSWIDRVSPEAAANLAYLETIWNLDKSHEKAELESIISNQGSQLRFWQMKEMLQAVRSRPASGETSDKRPEMFRKDSEGIAELERAPTVKTENEIISQEKANLQREDFRYLSKLANLLFLIIGNRTVLISKGEKIGNCFVIPYSAYEAGDKGVNEIFRMFYEDSKLNEGDRERNERLLADWKKFNLQLGIS